MVFGRQTFIVCPGPQGPSNDKCLIDPSNFIKLDQTRPNSTKQGGQTVKRLVTKQCLMGFGR